MPSVVVVFVLPVADDHSGLGERPEQVDVQAFVADPSVERFDVPVTPWLAGWEEGQANPFAGPVGHRGAGQFWSVVAAQHGRVPAAGGNDVELVDEGVGGDGPFDEA